MASRTISIAIAGLVLASSMAVPSQAQGVMVLDQAQDGGGQQSRCGTRPISIARLPWPSAAILAEIHSRLLARELGCTTQVLAGDLSSSLSAMAATGQPAVAPEVWASRVISTWNQAVEAQSLRPAGNSYDTTTFEGWYVPDYLAEVDPDILVLDRLAEAPSLAGNDLAGVGEDEDEGDAESAEAAEAAETATQMRFVTCPPDWGCAVINRNLITALGLTGRLDVVQPANRFEMDALIGEAISRQEPILFYYWQPNALLAQFDFRALDMGAFDADAAQCLARVACATPSASAFVPETVVTALAEWAFVDAGPVASYFQRAQMPIGEMNGLLEALNVPGMTPEALADQFIAEREDVWGGWVEGL